MKKADIWSKATAGLAAAALIGSALAATAVDEKKVAAAVTKINKKYLMTPQMGLDWNYYKSLGGPTYAGSPGWKHFTDFVMSQAQEFGLVDIDTVDAPYDHYIVNDWPDPNTHIYGSGVEVEKFISDGFCAFHPKRVIVPSCGFRFSRPPIPSADFSAWDDALFARIVLSGMFSSNPSPNTGVGIRNTTLPR